MTRSMSLKEYKKKELHPESRFLLIRKVGEYDFN